MGELMTDKKNTGAIITITGLSVLSLLFAIFTIWPDKNPQDEKTPASAGGTSTSAATPSITSTQLTAISDELAEGSCTDPATINRSDPEAVIKGFTEIAFCWDSTTDANTTAAVLRAQPLLTEDYYKSIDPNVRNSMNADFLAVSSSQAYTIPKVSFAPDEAGQVPEGFTAKEVIVEWTWLGRDGYEYKGGRALVSVAAVEEEPGRWAISGMQINSISSETAMLYSNTNQ
ncbi:hypothetical protein ACN08Y_10030 [Rothia sp. P5764]|uniref:hypothetical protein n=1 Tax=Rothia sp. P5764 TaxID=3402654 RepID=UPI003AD4DD46